MAGIENLRFFKPPGPKGTAFLRDTTSLVRAILGPVGGGKSSVCVFDLVRNASLMPVCRDGTIKFKVAIIGQTYGQLERNLFPTWKRWLPADDGPNGNWTLQDFKGGGGRYASHKIEWHVIREIDGEQRRVTVYFEALFAAIGDQVVEEFMRGFEPTAFWLYEVDLLPRAVLDQAIFRLGRFPSVADLPEGVTYRPYVICDLNAPDVDSWFYEVFEEEKPAGFELYKQPSGVSPQAENLHNLPPGYYDRQIAVFKSRKKGKNLIKRMVHAQYAPSSDGEAVYDEYSDETHLAAAPIVPRKNVPLIIGLDAGVQRPAAVIAQHLPTGQWLILGECIPGRSGPTRFVEALKFELAALAALAQVPHLTVGAMYSDPAGFTGADKEGGELAWAERVGVEMGVPVMPTETNELDPRLSAVRDELTYMIDGDTPAMMISPSCKMIRKGFASHYRYRTERVGNTERTSDKPEKNDFSHPHDALQYALLGKKGRAAVVNKRRGARDAGDGANAQPATVVVKDAGWSW